MGCGCRKKKTTDQRDTTAFVGGYQVWRNGSYTGRSFASMAQAQDYATRIGGEVRSA